MCQVLRSRQSPVRLIHMALCIYLGLWLAGCAAAPPRPEGDQLTHLQVRTYPVAMQTVFSAAVDAAQYQDFTVDVANADAGVLTATRQTDRKLARITGADAKGLPTWAWVVLIATGVIIIAAAVIILTSHDDDKKDDGKDKKKDDAASKGHHDGAKGETRETSKESQQGKTFRPDDQTHHRDTVRVKYKDKRRSESEYRHAEKPDHDVVMYQMYEEPDADFIVITDDTPHGKEWHQYRITFHFDNPGDNVTKVRLSVQGARLEGQEVQEAGPVYDPKFYDMFFSTLERSLRKQMPDSTAR